MDLGVSLFSRRSGIVAAVAALVVLGLSGCDNYEVSVEREGGVDYLKTSEVGVNETVWFWGFLPEFTEFQLDDEGEPILDDDGNFVPAADGEAWVDEFSTIVPAFLTEYPANHPLWVDAVNEDLRCSLDQAEIERWNADSETYETTTDEDVLAFCDDALEIEILGGGLSPFNAPYGPMTEFPSEVMDGAARFDLSEAQNFCGVRIVALQVPYTLEELDTFGEAGGFFDNLTPSEVHELYDNLVGFVEAGEMATTNGYFAACDDDNGSGGGAAPTTAPASTAPASTPPAPTTAPASTSTPTLAKTGANVEWLLVAGLLAVIAGAGFLTVSRRKRTE